MRSASGSMNGTVLDLVRVVPNVAPDAVGK